MNLIVLHGDSVVESYNRLQRFIKEARLRGNSIENVSENVNLTLRELLVSKNLFSQTTFFVAYEKSLSKKDLDWLNKNADKFDCNLVIYSERILPKTFIKSIPKKSKIEEYKTPQLIWKFLESFYPGNARTALSLLHKVLLTEPVELIFALLVGYLRDLYWVRLDKDSLNYPSWRIGKLGNQSEKFTKNRLKKIIAELGRIDLEYKTGSSVLEDSLDLLIIGVLE